MLPRDGFASCRSRVPKAVLVMTDGIQSRDSDALSLNRAAVYVVEKGARILVIGIGPKIVREELNLMVKSPAHLFTVESFDSLIRAARNVALRTCATPGKICPSFLTSDNVFSSPFHCKNMLRL